MRHDDDVRDDMENDLPGSSGVGTDGSLRSPEEPLTEHGADRSPEKGDGVGMDGSLVNPEKTLADHTVDRDERDPR